MPILHSPMKPVVGDWDPPEAEPPTWARRYQRLIRVGIVLTMALVAGLVGWNKLATADPGLRFSAPVAFRSQPGEVGGVRVIENRLGREVEIDFLRAGSFTVILELANEGSRDVKLRDLPRSPIYESTVEGVSWTWADSSASDEERERAAYEPFRPLSLPRGESVDIRFDLRFDKCERIGGGTVLSPSQVRELPLTYQAFGFIRTVDVPFEGAMLSLFDPGECVRQVPRS